MNAFSIACTTCNARLKVRDASAIGQIVACPKCGSMVLITAASAAAPAPSSTVAKPHPTGASPFDDPLPLEPPADSTPTAPAKSTAPAKPAATAAPSASAGEASGEQEGAGGEAADSTTADPTPAEAADVTTEPSRGANTWLWIGGGVAGGVALAVGLFMLITVLRGPGPQVAQNERLEAGSPTVEPTTPPPTADGSPPNPTPSQSPAAPDVPSPAAPPPGPEGKSPVGEPPSPEKPAPPMPPLEKPTGEAPAPAEKPAPAKPDAPSRELAEPEAPPGLTPKGGAETRPSTVAPIGGRFANLLSGDIAPSAESDASMDAKPPAAPAPTDDVVGSIPADEEIVRPRMREIDVPGRLADPIAKLQIKDMPLDEFVRLLSDLSTIPMTLDGDALRLRRIAATTPVSVQVEQSTVAGVLAAGLEPLQLGVRATDHGLRITHPDTPASQVRKRTYDVSDLVANDPQQLDVLRQWILDLVLPESWTEAGGEATLTAANGSLEVQNKDEAHFQILYFCDKLRAARRLPPKGKYPESWLAPGALPKRGEAALATVVKLNFNRSTRLTQILSRLGQVAKLRVLVDWDALADAGWTPETMARLTVDGVPLSAALQQLLGPRELTYRMLDDSTLEVTTRVAAARHVEWEFYDVSHLLEKDQSPQPLIEAWQEQLGAPVRFDPLSRTMLVALPYGANHPP